MQAQELSRKCNLSEHMTVANGNKKHDIASSSFFY